MKYASLFGLCRGLILPFIPLMLEVDPNSQVTLESHVHHNDCDRSASQQSCDHPHSHAVHWEEDSDEEFRLAGYGSCAYCGCPAFTESDDDSYRCTCGHGWDGHFSAGA